MKIRSVAVLLCAALLSSAPALAAPLPSPSPATERPTRTIAIFLNGEPLLTDTPPLIMEGRLLVPLRPIFEALGISIVRSGDTITARLPVGNFALTVPGDSVSVNGHTVSLDGRSVDISGTTYVPLRLLKAALGATAVYDQRGAKVQIVSAFIGRALGAEERHADGGMTVNGVVAAVDVNSSPPSVTLTQGAESRTISINSDAKIFIEDVTVHSQVKADLSDVRVGDRLAAILAKDGRVVELHDFYSSDNGTISALSPFAVVLQNGRVVQPAKSTEITLNGASAKLADLAVGDSVTVRRNPESGEIRQLIASRTAAASATALPANGNVTVTGFTISANRPLRAGESFDVVLVGTAGGKASFDIGDYVSGIDLHEDSPGTYRGHFTVPDRFNVTQVPVYGHLSLGATQAPRTEASATFSAATTPPQIPEVAPPPGQTVNNARPNIYATFVTPSQIPINLSSVSLAVNGHDVTSSATRTPSFITYTPSIDYPDGRVEVTVKVADAAGNTATRTWSFVIKTH
jgi:hypothetical protein